MPKTVLHTSLLKNKTPHVLRSPSPLHVMLSHNSAHFSFLFHRYFRRSSTSWFRVQPFNTTFIIPLFPVVDLAVRASECLRNFTQGLLLRCLYHEQAFPDFVVFYRFERCSYVFHLMIHVLSPLV